MQSTTPEWQTLFNIIGVSSLIVALLSGFLSSRAQRRNWINDNKKLEWRQLIDGLRDCEALLRLAFTWPDLIKDRAKNNAEVSNGSARGAQIINDRIFIADVVSEFEIKRKWNELVEIALTYQMSIVDRPMMDANETVRTAMDFLGRFAELHDEIVNLARKDLMKAPWWKWL